jgi:hypothetical protein
VPHGHVSEPLQTLPPRNIPADSHPATELRDYQHGGRSKSLSLDDLADLPTCLLHLDQIGIGLSIARADHRREVQSIELQADQTALHSVTPRVLPVERCVHEEGTGKGLSCQNA